MFQKNFLSPHGTPNQTILKKVRTPPHVQKQLIPPTKDHPRDYNNTTKEILGPVRHYEGRHLLLSVHRLLLKAPPGAVLRQERQTCLEPKTHNQYNDTVHPACWEGRPKLLYSRAHKAYGAGEEAFYNERLLDDSFGGV